MPRAALTLALIVLPVALAAQDFQLTVENIMRGPELVGTSPSRVRFSPDGRTVYFTWRAPGVDTLDETYRVALAGGAPERLPRHVLDTLTLADGVWAPDLQHEVVVLKGDLYLVDRAGSKRRLTETAAVESAPSWSVDGRTVFFTREGNAWALALSGGLLAQLTDIRRGEPPRTAPEATGQKKFLRDQQLALFDFIRRQVWTERLAADTDTTGRRPLYLPEGQTAQRLEVSPDGRFVLATVWIGPTGADSARTAVLPTWVTQSGYVETQRTRTKVGDARDRFRTAVIDVATGRTTWIDSTVGSGERDVWGVGISPNGRHALVRAASTSYKDAWLAVVDLPTQATRVVAHQHDDAWLDGPLGFTAGWMRDGETLYYGSEETGWAHLYAVPAAGGSARALTSGRWEVHVAELSPDGKTFYLQTNEADWTQLHCWALDVASGRKAQLTTAEGRQDVVVSPDGKTLAVLHSTANHPPELYVQANRPGAGARRLTESTSPQFRSFHWIKPEIVMVPARDGAAVPGRLYRPSGAPNHAAVIFVHGAGYLQNVHQWWSDYYREYMFHHLLAARGYAVLDLDYRGSAGLGRDWRTATYRHMGDSDLDDQVDGARWLVRQLGVDSARIGIYGGSYGGFITLMAMFTRPGVFAAGAALRPVTDWAHYNEPYTARILNEPQDDSLAYRRSSPINFAQGLVGHLLICHGMVDNNVHFEDTARLIQRLIELGKQDWEVAIYPVESHGFLRADSWTDEYRRILKLFEETLGRGS